jgi:hypothetical protein
LEVDFALRGFLIQLLFLLHCNTYLGVISKSIIGLSYTLAEGKGSQVDLGSGQAEIGRYHVEILHHGSISGQLRQTMLMTNKFRVKDTYRTVLQLL